MPADVLDDWLTEVWGRSEASTDLSQAHANSAVYELRRGNERAFLKLHRDQRKFEQERRAYVAWCPHLDSVPRLLAAREVPPRALLLAACEGASLQHAEVSRADETDIFAAAGRWLAQLHELPDVDDDPMPLPDAIVARAESWATRGAHVVSKRERHAVLDLARHAQRSGVLPAARVPCHRDFTRRNWIWDGAHISIIDFEHSRMDAALVDVERLRSSVPEGRDDLLAAFDSGYGRTLNASENTALTAITAISALSRVVWAVEHDDPEFERLGRSQLARVLSTS